MGTEDRAGALDGVRIIDLTTVLMGPLASRMLGDHGADVIRVESPAATTAAGHISPDGVTAIVLNTQRNKRSVTVDLKTEAGAAAMRTLVGSADVLVSNMRAGALARLGLDADTLRAEHPGLIHCVANGYGADGPYADRAAYDDAIQALSGLAALEGRISGEPKYVPSVIVDKILALHVVQAVMAAIIHRRSTGEGQTIRVPMFETMVAFNMVEHLRGAALVPPKGEVGYKRLLNPNRRPYRCADGYICLLPYTTEQWERFLAIVDQPELLGDPRFATFEARVNNAEEVYAFVAEVAPRHTVDEWIALCDEQSIPANPVLDLADMFEDQHIQAVDLMPIVEHPTEGPYRTVRDPISYDTLETRLRRHAPVPGQHTTEVFTELGLTADQIADLA